MPRAPDSVLISAGEVSGDRYAALLVEELRARWPDAKFFGCTGPKLRDAGVETVVRSEELAVVGIVEVVRHVPRIWGEFRKLLRGVRERGPGLAILTDSPDFHLRVARKLMQLRVPVVYLVAPQVWAWRKGRIRVIRRLVRRLLCIFPFEERFFLDRGVRARYIGHPLVEIVRPFLPKTEFLQKHGIAEGVPLIAILPGSRKGEAARHLPDLVGAVELLRREFPTAQFLIPASPNTGTDFFRERIGPSSIQVIEGEARDAMAHADAVMAASGTVTVEAALLSAPMVVFYRVSGLTWLLGRKLVTVPFFSMVNLIAGKRVVTELIQDDMTPAALASETATLLRSSDIRRKMVEDLKAVAASLTVSGSAMSRAADEVERVWEESIA